MKQRILRILAVAMMFVAGMSLLKPVYAAESSEMWIVLRCTVTLSVSLQGTPTSFVLGDVSAGTTVYSTSGVTIRNNSQGAISSWDLNIQDASLDSWTLASAPGLNQVAIYGVFQTTAPTAAYNSFHVTRDTFSITARQYTAGLAYGWGAYNSQGHLSQEHRILPSTYDALRCDRRLWIKMLTPLAVTDENVRTIILVVTAKMAG